MHRNAHNSDTLKKKKKQITYPNMNHWFKIALWTFRKTLCCHLKLLRFFDDIISLCSMSAVDWIVSSQTSHVESLTPAWLYLETSYTQTLVTGHWETIGALSGEPRSLRSQTGLTQTTNSKAEHPLSLGTRLSDFQISPVSFLFPHQWYLSVLLLALTHCSSSPHISEGTELQSAFLCKVAFKAMLSTLSELKSTQCWRCLRAGHRPLLSLFWGLFTQPLVVHAPSLRPGPCSYHFPLSPSLQPLQCEAAQNHSIHNPALFVLNTTHCHPGYYPFTCLLFSDCPPSREDEPLLQALLAYHYVSTPVLMHRTQKPQHQHLLTGWGRAHCR